jgi:hypothetical protein
MYICVPLQVPMGSDITAGSQFPWQQALEPRWYVTIPNPTHFFYFVSGYACNAAVSNMQSPVAFSGSIVQLMIASLLGRPSEYPFTVSSDDFTQCGSRADQSRPVGDSDKGRNVSGPGVVPNPCDKITGAAQLRCQQLHQRLTQPLRPEGRAVLPDRGVRLTKEGAASILDKARTAAQNAYGRDRYDVEDGSYASQPEGSNGDGEGSGKALIPQWRSDLRIFLKALDSDIATATGELTQDNFTTTSCELPAFVSICR